MKVTLLRLPTVAPFGSINNEPSPPLGLAYIAGILKQSGFEIQGIDATGEALYNTVAIPNTKLQYVGLDIEDIIEKIDPESKVIAVSSTFSHEWTFIKNALYKIKSKHPEKLIILGGEHATALDEFLLSDCTAIDGIVLGEGESTFLEFCQSLNQGHGFRHIEGMSFLDKEGRYVKNHVRDRIRDLSEIPWPAWEEFPLEVYLDNHVSFGASFGRNMPLLASRGCPYQCTFCSNEIMWTTRYNIRPVAEVIAEIKFYVNKYKITGIQFYDLTAIIQKKWIVDFCKALIKEDLNLDWSLPSGTRSEALDDESLYWMSKANLKYIVYAPESGSLETLQKIKKKISLDKMTYSIKAALKLGINVRTNFIIGFPHERRKELWKTLMTQIYFSFLGVDETPLFSFQPYPGTELFKELVENNKISLNDSYFNSLATFSNGKLGPPDASYSNYLGRFEIWFYRIVGMISGYIISYLSRPKRILRTIKNLFFTETSATVLEQRLKEKLRSRNRIQNRNK